MTKFFGILFAAAVFFAANYSFQPSQKASDTLLVGTQSGYPPFEFLDSSGKLTGFDVDLAALIAEKLGKPLVFHDMEFEAEILSLKQGKIDLILSGMNITPQRLKEIAMVPYHGQTTDSLSLIFWDKIPSNIKSLKDLAGLPISVQTGSVSETFLNLFPTIQTKSFQGTLAPLMDVKFGKSVANLVESDVAVYLQQKHPNINILSVPLPNDQVIYGFGIGIKKENQKLYEEIGEIIQELKASGAIQKLEDKWFKGTEP